MHAPEFVCKALYRTHPWLRLAWMGAPPKNEDDINPGCFAIVQLYYISDIGSITDALTYRELWDTTIRENEAGTPERVRIQRGPIFSRNGLTRPDWDPLFRVPVFVMTLDSTYRHPMDDTPITTQDVMSGKIIPTLQYFLRPIKQRIKDSHRASKQRIRAAAQEIGGMMGEELEWLSHKHDTAVRKDLAYKHIKKDIARLDDRNQRRKDPIY